MIIDYSENFYFDVAIHCDELDSKWTQSKYSLKDMAESAYLSEHWTSLSNLTPDNLDRLIEREETSANWLSSEYNKTCFIRSSTFAATLMHIGIIIAAIVAMIIHKNVLLLIILLGVVTMGLLLIPITRKAAMQIADLKRRLTKQQQKVSFLHLAKKELDDTITRHHNP